MAYSFRSDRQSEIFGVEVGGVPVPVAVVPDVSAEERDQIVVAYRELPSYCWPGSRHITVHYARFSA